MEPHIEHTFYTWLIIIGIVCIATFVGAVIDRVRLLRANRVALRRERLRKCMKS